MVLAAWSIAAAATGMSMAAAETYPTAPCLVLVTFDTTRREAFGAFGGPAGLSPNLDSLAGAVTRYTSAVAPSPLTLHSHATLLTGIDTRQHGVRTKVNAELPGSMETLAEVLRRKG